MRTTVITLVAGRHAHLRLQLRGLTRSARTPDDHVVVSMGDPAVAPLIEAEGYPAHTVTLPAGGPLPPSAGGPSPPSAGGPLPPSAGRPLPPSAGGPLSLSTARNVGAECALARGAELLVFLDVDCIPSAGLLGLYERAASDPRHGSALLCGPVTYLPPPGPRGYDLGRLERSVNPHPARPNPPGRHDPHRRRVRPVLVAVVRGDPRDVDGRRGASARTTSGTAARTPTSPSAPRTPGWGCAGSAARMPSISTTRSPTRRSSICTRSSTTPLSSTGAGGRWPMTGWLTRFAEAGLARYDAAADRWVATAAHAGRGRGRCLDRDARGNSVGT